MNPGISGTWELKVWRQVDADGKDIFPFGKHPVGTLIYTEDGNMAVYMFSADRPHLNTDSPIGGDVEERAQAYSSCLAYFGTYQVDGEAVIHNVQAALFPNWSNTRQERPYALDGNQLSLRVFGEDGQITNEIVWIRKGSDS